MNTIGITLPIRNGNLGYFEQSYDSITQIKSNLLNFFSTRPTERRFNPTFGTRLYNYLFEQNVSEFEDILKTVIKEDVETWFPNVFVNQVFLDYPPGQKTKDNDNYIIRIRVQFNYNNQSSSFSFDVTNNT